MRDLSNVSGPTQPVRGQAPGSELPSRELNAASASSAESRGAASTPLVQISIVVPLCNESDNIAPLTRRIFEAFRNETRSLELILVDDGSTDTTWEQILAVRKADPRVRALRHTRRSGQSAALWSGFLATRGEVLCTLDGDLQNDPADLPGMLSKLAECDLVCGVRLDRQDGTLRRISASVARRARKAVLGVDFRDTGCNLRVFKRSVLQKVFPFDGLHRFMPILAHAGGAVVREVPVSHHPRPAGLSKYGVWNRLGRGIVDLMVVAWYRKRQISTVEVVEYQSGP